MLKMFRSFLSRWFKTQQRADADTAEHDVLNPGDDSDFILATPDLVPIDENLLERARTQWQFGDWESLAQLDRNSFQHHPDRAKLALLAAAGHMQKGHIESARPLIRLAQDWGCSKKLIGQIMIAGVHNSLGRAAAAAGQAARAQLHFEGSLRTGMPNGELKLLARARAHQQISDLGLNLESNFVGLIKQATSDQRT